MSAYLPGYARPTSSLLLVTKQSAWPKSGDRTGHGKPV